MTIQQAMSHARAYLKVAPTYLEVEEVRMANTINSIIGSFYRWHWATAAGTDISLSNAVQDYSLATADQNTVLAVQNAYLTDASNTYPELVIDGDHALPVTATTGRPHTFCLISPTQIRFFVTPNGTFTFKWRKHKRPTVFTGNTESFDCPSAFDAIVKSGMNWQALSYKDDSRAPEHQKAFYDLLAEQKTIERVAMGRTR